jgi:endonuclease-8
MPEGDTIFRAARTLHAALAGRIVTRFETVLPKLARVDDDAPIAGRTVDAVGAHGKHQLLRLSARPDAEGARGVAGPLVLRTHMRMSGSWHLYRPGERWQRPRGAMRLVIETEAYVAVGFDVPVAELVPAAALARDEDLRRLGPDLLAEDFDAAEAIARLRARGRAAVADALLDQSALAGVGNVFKCEILFVAGVSPFRSVASLGDDELARVVEIARRLLGANVGPGKGDGIVTYTGGRRTTGRADPAQRLWVYSRGGEPCRRCGTPIAYARQGRDARGTYWCPSCQPEA